MRSYTQRLRVSIDDALAVSYRRNVYDGKAKYVGHISLVKGIPFFGYHVGYRYFLKIYMLNPLNMTRFADLLYQGAITGQTFQPFESHLQYLLQWMCDFNLYGCAYIDCNVLKFRGPVPDYTEINNEKDKWHSRSIKPEWMSNPGDYPRQSHCSLEVDICAQDILNRNEIEMRDQHADFVERFGPLKPEEKLVHSLARLWKDETRRRKRGMGLTDPSSSPFPPEVLVTMSADPRNTGQGGWIHENEYRERVQELIKAEKVGPCEKPSFDDFVKPLQQENSVRTVLESVEDLFPQNLEPQGPALDIAQVPEPHSERVEPNGIVVDETTVKNSSYDDFPYGSDEEVAREIAMTQRNRNTDLENLKDLHRANGDLVTHIQQHSVANTHETRAEGAEHDLEVLKEQRLAVDNLSEAGINAHIPLDLHASRDGSAKRPATFSPEEDTPKQLRSNDLSPRKRSRLAERGQLDNGSEETDSDSPTRPRSRHVKFEDPPSDSLSTRNLSQQKRSEDNTPTSSQLSQSSINAHGIHETSSLSFAVVKNPYKPQRPRDQKPPAGDETPGRSTSSTIPRPSKDSPVTPLNKSRTSSAYESPVTPTSLPSSQVLSIASHLHDEFAFCNAQVLGQLPPNAQEVTTTFFELGYPDVVYQDAFYSEEKDVPERARDYAGREFKLWSTTIPFLPPFNAGGTSAAAFGAKQPILLNAAKEELLHDRRRRKCELLRWEIAQPPPSWGEVEEWIRQERADNENTLTKNGRSDADSDRGQRKAPNLSQVDGPTQKNPHGFKFSQKKNTTSVRHETQYMSIMSLEIHVNTRGHLMPNPEEDEVSCLFWCIKLDDDELKYKGSLQGTRVGILAMSEDDSLARKISQDPGIEVEVEETELDLMNRMVDIVREFDPDILTGFEVHNGSWGYLMERARLKYEYDLCDEFSRMISQFHGRFGGENDRWGFNTTSTIRVTGRHMINIWRAMRGELNLLQYTMENVAFHLLHKRIPHYSFQDLTSWYKSNKPQDMAKCIQYFLSRVQMNLEILDANELVPRTSEQASLIGVDFFSVFSRGSQFKVESFMFRIAKPENFLLVSPSRKQVGQQNALECLPLVMEPQSAFYNSPLLVLDFQSLYPSIMIAYNYCYSTCLGRAVSWRGQNKMGFADFKRQPRLLELVKDSINVAPNGIMYVKPSMRKSLLAKMLGEILETRVMVKSGMKQDKQDKTLQQLLNNRQLALKLLANVTYGYTSASFSGRMPCSEIADSIVQTGRETLEKAIALIHSVSSWGAEVVYGDTDSLFVYLQGRTREQAFSIGQEIADAVTKLNPRPIKLKFEKVYHPCILLAKKRYVGFKYESPSQQEPEFDAKGIETVRRNGTPAEQKVEEKALKILFRTADLSQVKQYFQRQCTKIMQGRVSIQDFCFAREVKLGTYADKGPPPPGALISCRRMLVDPRTEPQYGERVPYVVVTGAPGARLIDRCVAPETLLSEDGGDHAELDADYYIMKTLIPPLERIFNLVGANVRLWYEEMPKVLRVRDIPPVAVALVQSGDGQNEPLAPTKKTLENYLKTSHCVVCRSKLPPPQSMTRPISPVAPPVPLCPDCHSDAPNSLYALRRRLHSAQRKGAGVEAVCRSCASLAWAEQVRCDSRDCPVFYSRIKERGKVKRVERLVEWVGGVLEEATKVDDLEW